MMYRTLWTPQAEAFILGLPHDPRQAIRQAIKQLARGRPGELDLRPLEGRLQGYMRLRVQTYRIIYKVSSDKRGPAVTLVAAGPRSTVYEAFEKILAEQTAD